MTRKIIQIAVTDNEDIFTLTALCDDGSVWTRRNNRRWFKQPDIPQPLSEYEKQRIDELLRKDRQGRLDADEIEELKDLLTIK